MVNTSSKKIQMVKKAAWLQKRPRGRLVDLFHNKAFPRTFYPCSHTSPFCFSPSLTLCRPLFSRSFLHRDFQKKNDSVLREIDSPSSYGLNSTLQENPGRQSLLLYPTSRKLSLYNYALQLNKMHPLLWRQVCIILCITVISVKVGFR